MSIIYGRKHGNGYHDNVYQKITVKHSKAFNNLIDYEFEQLEKHGNIIYEKNSNPSWIKRVCIVCPTSYKDGKKEYMEKQDNGTFKCVKCGLIKIPKGVDYKDE